MKRKLEIGREYPFKGEDKYIFTLVRDVQKELAKSYGPGDTKRKAHPKMHGLLKAEFIVEEDLPSDLKVGVFRYSKSYPCWIRYSNANAKIQPDYKKDVRGMALKIFKVSGKKLLSDKHHHDEQDFLLVSMPTFPAKNARQFQHFLRITSESILKVLLPTNWKLIPLVVRFVKVFVKPGNLLQIPFWSAVPYQFGDEDRAVKYHVRPQLRYKDPVPENPTDWYLRDALIETLGRGEILLDFLIQFQEDPYKMPIENSGVEWTSEFKKVATIRIPQQDDFKTQERDLLGENLAFSPWNSLPEHRPLGSINRARRAVYDTLAKFRHDRNKVHVEMTVPEVRDTVQQLPTNMDRLKRLVVAYRDNDMQLITQMLRDDVVWRQPPTDMHEKLKEQRKIVNRLGKRDIAKQGEQLTDLQLLWEDLEGEWKKTISNDEKLHLKWDELKREGQVRKNAGLKLNALQKDLRNLKKLDRRKRKGKGIEKLKIKVNTLETKVKELQGIAAVEELRALELHRIPFAGEYIGIEKVLEMFYIHSKTAASEFIQPFFIGAPNDETLALYGQEKVDIIGDYEGEMQSQLIDGEFKPDLSNARFPRLKGGYETTFVLIVQFDQESKVKSIDSLYDTEEVAENFANARISLEDGAANLKRKS